MKNYKKAFSMIELVVVMSIVAILSTISFLSYNSYSADARDSVRVSDLADISQGLMLDFSQGGVYLIPDNNIAITISGVTIGYQGYVGSRILPTIKISSGGGKDPLDNVYYTYNTNVDQDKFEVMGFLEKGTNIYTYEDIEKTYATPASYSNRILYGKGDSLGILLSSGTLLPIQYNNSGSGFELYSYSGGTHIGFVNNKLLFKNKGIILGGLAGYYLSHIATTQYPGCDTADITLPNGMTWSACNIGATKSWNNQGIIKDCSGEPDGGVVDCNSNLRYTLGNLYQWGRNDDVTNSSITNTLAPTGTLAGGVGHNLFINTSSYPGAWISTTNYNLWGRTGSTETGSYISLGKPKSMQGPCAKGYHVPTMYEWTNSFNSLNPFLDVYWSGFDNDYVINDLLKIPYSGMRAWNGKYYYGGRDARIWSSTPYDYADPYNRDCGLDIEIAYMSSIGKKYFSSYADRYTQGFPVRCMRNN